MGTAAVFRKAFPYAKDAMNLPVRDVDAAIPFYEGIMGFQLASRQETPVKSAVLQRDDIRIGLAENGGEPEQEGCFFEVDDVDTACAELKQRGYGKDIAFRIDRYGDKSFRVFFVVAPDGLCYCLGQRVA
jgi:predicted enzyme related to lactoylglutathione lyase